MNTHCPLSCGICGGKWNIVYYCTHIALLAVVYVGGEWNIVYYCTHIALLAVVYVEVNGTSLFIIERILPS